MLEIAARRFGALEELIDGNQRRRLRAVIGEVVKLLT
jgi:hypothetical protein